MQIWIYTLAMCTIHTIWVAGNIYFVYCMDSIVCIYNLSYTRKGCPLHYYVPFFFLSLQFLCKQSWQTEEYLQSTNLFPPCNIVNSCSVRLTLFLPSLCFFWNSFLNFCLVNYENSITKRFMISGDDCDDKFRNCHLVVQARLCKYKYYRNSCCHSCHKKS